MKSSYEKHLDVLEVIALHGTVSGYELSKELGISVSHPQWWLKNYPPIREVERERKYRKRVLYGLTMIGFLMALKRPRVRRNFAGVYEKFLGYQEDMKEDPKLRKNMIEAIRSEEIAEKLKQYYLAISSALDKLTDIYSLDPNTVVDLASMLAFSQEKNFGLFRDLYLAKVPIFERVVNFYRLIFLNFDKIIKGEMP